MDHSGAPEQVKDIDEEMAFDSETITSKKGNAKVSVKPTKLAARRLAKRFGGIPGVPVGAKWGTRSDCSDASVHRPLMAGICGSKTGGAFSIVVSCHYKDDKDLGDTIYYTGTGGRKRWTDDTPPKRIRVGPQVYDQQWTDWGNEALVTSRDTGNPVRVIRSHKVLSDFAPEEGYRYDGLYTVEKAWKEKNLQGLDICRYKLERIPGQPPLSHRSRKDANHEPSPASVATSDTIVSPSGTSIGCKRKTRPFASQDDLPGPIRADGAPKKRKFADRPPPPSLPSLSSSSAAPVPATFQTPLQRHKQRVQDMMQKDMQYHFPGTSSTMKTAPTTRQPPSTLVKPNIRFGPRTKSQPNRSPAMPVPNVSCHEDDEDANMFFDDEEDEDEDEVIPEDLETAASPISSFLSPSPFRASLPQV